jgi:hypothetical protein
MLLSKHAVAQACCCPSMLLPKHAVAQACCCPRMLLPKHAVAQACYCPSILLPKHADAQACFCPSIVCSPTMNHCHTSVQTPNFAAFVCRVTWINTINTASYLWPQFWTRLLKAHADLRRMLPVTTSMKVTLRCH